MATTNAIFKNRIDNAEEVEVGKTYDTPQIIQLLVPSDVGQGDYLDVNGDKANFDTEPLAVVPVGWTQAAADLTPAEFALVNLAEARAVADIGEPGLRGEPVANTTALTALIAKDYEKRKILDTGTEWVFELGKAPTGTDLADDATTGAWVEVTIGTSPVSALTGGFIYLEDEDPANGIFAMNGQTITGGVANYPTLAAKWSAWVSGANIVLPDWRGRAMMATGALGITGAVGATYADATSQNGLAYDMFIAGAGGGTNGGTDRQSLWGGHQTSTGGGNQSNIVRLTSHDPETRPNAVGLVLCVIAGDLVVQAIENPTPTTSTIITRGGNVNGNDFTSHGMYQGNNTGFVIGTIFGNWTWKIRVQVIGDWITQHYFNDTGNNAYRESFDGGTNWTAWAF